MGMECSANLGPLGSLAALDRLGRFPVFSIPPTSTPGTRAAHQHTNITRLWIPLVICNPRREAKLNLNARGCHQPTDPPSS